MFKESNAVIQKSKEFVMISAQVSPQYSYECLKHISHLMACVVLGFSKYFSISMKCIFKY